MENENFDIDVSFYERSQLRIAYSYKDTLSSSDIQAKIEGDCDDYASYYSELAEDGHSIELKNLLLEKKSNCLIFNVNTKGVNYVGTLGRVEAEARGMIKRGESMHYAHSFLTNDLAFCKFKIRSFDDVYILCFYGSDDDFNQNSTSRYFQSMLPAFFVKKI